MQIVKTSTVSGTLCHNEKGENIALIVPAGHGLHNVMPNEQLVKRMGAQSRCCCGTQAAELFVKVLASEWDYFRR